MFSDPSKLILPLIASDPTPWTCLKNDLIHSKNHTVMLKSIWSIQIEFVFDTHRGEREKKKYLTVFSFLVALFAYT